MTLLQYPIWFSNSKASNFANVRVIPRINISLLYKMRYKMQIMRKLHTSAREYKQYRLIRINQMVSDSVLG